MNLLTVSIEQDNDSLTKEREKNKNFPAKSLMRLLLKLKLN